MRRAYTWILAAELARALRAAARPADPPSLPNPEETAMNDQAPPAQNPSSPSPDPAQPAQPAQPAPQPGAAAGGAGGGAAQDVPAITDYLPVVLAAASGLLKTASAIQKQVDDHQEVPAFYVDMAGNFLGVLGILAEAYRRSARRGGEPAHGGALPGPGGQGSNGPGSGGVSV